LSLHPRAPAVAPPSGNTPLEQDAGNRVPAADALRLSHGRLLAVIRNLREGLIISDLRGELIYWNPAALWLHGLDEHAEGRRNLRDLHRMFELASLQGSVVPPGQWPLARILRGEQLSDVEVRVRSVTGDWERIFSFSGSIVDDAGDRSLAFLAIHDITASKLSERDLLLRGIELQGLATRLSHAEETERERLAQELHDQVGSILTALNLNLTIIGRQIPPQADGAIKRRLDDSMVLVDQTIGFVRGLMTELRPPVLDDYGIAPALRWYVEQFRSRTGLEVNVEAPLDSVRRPRDVEIAVFRVAQEALSNVMKHAQARRVTISLEDNRDLLRLTIADDGRGYSPANASDAEGGMPHWGLVMMRERAQSIGGRVRVDGLPGRGTRVVVEVPT
jgi:signal transduction histidine kinase